MSQLEIEDEVATDLQRATGTADAGAGDSTRLNRVLQLTGALVGSCLELGVYNAGVRPHVAISKGGSAVQRQSGVLATLSTCANACGCNITSAREGRVK